MKPNNVIYLKCTGDSFFRTWVEFLAPFHKLAARERDVAARIIAQYFKLKRRVSDPVLINEMLWTTSSRKDMRESLGMSREHFQMILGKLHASGLLMEDNSIEPRFLPHLADDPRLLLNIIFDWSSKSNPIRARQEQEDI